MSGSRTIELRYDVSIPEPKDEGDPIHVWLPLPASTPQQEVLGLQTHSSMSLDMRYDAVFGNAILHGVSRGEGARNAHIGYRAIIKRSEWRVDLSAPRRDGLTQDEQLLRAQLVQTRKVRFLPDIVAAANEIRAIHRDALKIARAAYDHVLATMIYDKSGEGWGEGDTEWACSTGRGNCTDIHTLFLAILRCCGIACEFEIGAAFPPGLESGDITAYKCGYHCWVRFFVPGLGWVPADVSEASRHPQMREYFFGAIDADRVLLSRGRDIVVGPESRSGAENFFTEPRIEKASGTSVVYEKRLEFSSLSM